MTNGHTEVELHETGVVLRYSLDDHERYHIEWSELQGVIDRMQAFADARAVSLHLAGNAPTLGSRQQTEDS